MKNEVLSAGVVCGADSAVPAAAAQPLKVALCLAGEPPTALETALQSAGHCVQRLPVQSLPHVGSFIPEPDVAIVDCESVNRPAAASAVAELSQRIPVVMLTAEPAHREPALHEDLRAAALLPHPVQTAALLANLQLWVQRHREAQTLRANEADLMAALLSSRRISSAVGMLAERHGISIDEAFNRLRSRARANRQRTEELARGIISRQENPC
jgi:AmiR/NasT family two-component response regulator